MPNDVAVLYELLGWVRRSKERAVEKVETDDQWFTGAACAYRDVERHVAAMIRELDDTLIDP